jgi:hypothetical protein
VGALSVKSICLQRSFSTASLQFLGAATDRSEGCSLARAANARPVIGLLNVTRRTMDPDALDAASARGRLWQILLQKSFCTGDQKFSGL